MNKATLHLDLNDPLKSLYMGIEVYHELAGHLPTHVWLGYLMQPRFEAVAARIIGDSENIKSELKTIYGLKVKPHFDAEGVVIGNLDCCGWIQFKT